MDLLEVEAGLLQYYYSTTTEHDIESPAYPLVKLALDFHYCPRGSSRGDIEKFK